MAIYGSNTGRKQLQKACGVQKMGVEWGGEEVDRGCHVAPDDLVLLTNS